MYKKLVIPVLVIFLGLLTTQKIMAADPEEKEVSANAAIKWLTMEEAEELTAKEPRKLFVYIYSTKCGWCKKMDEETFRADNIITYLNTHFYPVKLDVESETPITVGGNTYNFDPQRSFHEFAIKLLNGQMSYPANVCLDEQLQPIETVPGYRPPEKMQPVLIYFTKNYYRTMNLDGFLQEWAKIMQAKNR
jgi:thioredoxin-related protein